MPYKIVKHGEQECVAKEGGETKHCYSGPKAHSQALAYMRALYAAEGSKKEIEDIDKELSEMGFSTKEIEDLTAKCGGMGEYGPYVPWGVKSFAELDEWQKTYETAKEVAFDTNAFQQIVSNIMGSYELQMNEKLAAVKGLADEFAGRVDDTVSETKEAAPAEPPTPEEKSRPDFDGIVTAVIDKVKDLFGLSKIDKSEGFMAYKETDGSYAWIARYSNNFRDQDNPPEIISSASHQRFVERVEKGLAPLPELWIWHVKEWRIGKADWVTYDLDSGFALAGGHSLPGMEPVFEAMSNIKGIKVSHGMPNSTIVRDATDKSVLIEHETREISPLPGWAAANKLTGFVVLDNDTKEADMAIPADKREKLIKEWGISDELLTKIEAANADDSQKAKDEGLEHKETTETAAPETPAAPAAPEAEKQDKQPDATPAAVPAEASGAEKAISELTELIKSLKADVDALKQAKQSEAEAVKETVRETPLAGIFAKFGGQGASAIGDASTQVDGRTSLAKSKPSSPKENVEGRTLVPFINEILAGKQPGQQA